MANMIFKRRGDIFIALHTENAPSDEEWRRFIDATLAAANEHKGDFTKVKSLVITDGGGPNAAQRKLASDMLSGRQACTAVISHSSLIRGVITAMAWFNAKVKAFSPDERASAFRHLEIPDAIARTVWSDACAMRPELGVTALLKILK
jgi:hypothetical protein